MNTATNIQPLYMEVPSAELQHKGGSFMPIKLRSLLAENNIPQAEWGAAIKQPNGKSLSSSAQTQILRWNIWPKKTSAESIKEQTVEFLTDKTPDYSSLVTIWDEELDNDKRQSNPTKKAGSATNTTSLMASIKSNGIEKALYELNLPEAVMLSQKAKQHFKLITDPFQNDVTKPSDVFLSTEQRYIRESMRHASKHSGFLAVIGESGAGKSTLRRDLIDYIRQEKEKIIVIQPKTFDKGRLTPAAICDAIVGDMSAELNPTLPRSLEAKARMVERILTDSSRLGNSHVLIIEEAHDLTIPALKYLKRFWEIEDGHTKLLGIVIIGQPELKLKLNEQVNYEAREVIRRIEQAELLPLDNDLEAYLTMKFKKLNIGINSVMADDAFDAIRQKLTFQKRGGGNSVSLVYPLVVNNLVKKAMNLAADNGETLINAELIAEV